MRSFLKRLLRNALSGAIAGGLAILNEEPIFLGIAPILNATFKYLRDKNPDSWIWRIL